MTGDILPRTKGSLSQGENRIRVRGGDSSVAKQLGEPRFGRGGPDSTGAWEGCLRGESVVQNSRFQDQQAILPRTQGSICQAVDERARQRGQCCEATRRISPEQDLKKTPSRRFTRGHKRGEKNESVPVLPASQRLPGPDDRERPFKGGSQGRSWLQKHRALAPGPELSSNFMPIAGQRK